MAFGILGLVYSYNDVAVLHGRMLSGMQCRYLAVIQVRPAMLEGIEEALEAVVDIPTPVVRREYVDVDYERARERADAPRGEERADRLTECPPPARDERPCSHAPPVMVDGRGIRQGEFEHHARFHGGAPLLAGAAAATGADGSRCVNALISFTNSPVSVRFLTRT